MRNKRPPGNDKTVKKINLKGKTLKRMVAFANGNRGECKKILRKQLRYLGKKRAHGHGRITSIETEETECDWSFLKDGRAMRWLPDEGGLRLVRTMPPYWNRINRVKCCEVGTEIEIIK